MKRFTDLLKIAAMSLMAALFVGSCGLIGTEKPGKEEPEETAEELPLGEFLDYSDPAKTGVAVLEYDMEDGYIAITTTPDKAPKQGDIIASGITEKTPLGLLVQVVYVETVDNEVLSDVGVKSSDGKNTYIMYTLPVNIDKALESLGIKYNGWVSDHANGNATKSSSKPIDLTICDIKVPLEWNNDPSNEAEEKKEDYEWKEYWETGLKVNISEQLILHDFDFFYDNTQGESSCQGFRADFHNKFAMDFNGKLKWVGKYDDIFEHYSTSKWDLEPDKPSSEWYPTFEFAIGPVVVVVTFKLSLKAPVKTSFEIGCDKTVFKKNTQFTFGAIWKDNKAMPLEESGSNFLFTTDLPYDGSDAEEDKHESRFHVVGEGEFSAHAFASVGLYGSNLTSKELSKLLDKTGISTTLIDRWEDWKKKQDQKKDEDKKFKFKYDSDWLNASFEFDLFKFNGKLDLGIEYKGNSFLDGIFSYDTFPTKRRAIDTYLASVSLFPWKAVFTLYELKLDAGWNTGKTFIGIENFHLKLKKEYSGDFDIFTGTAKGHLLYPDYSDIKVNVDPEQFITVSAKRENPLFGRLAFTETNCGFTIGKVGSTDPKSYYIDEPFTERKGTISKKLPIKASELEINVPYAIYPVTVAKTVFSAYMFEENIYRSGVHFIYDGRNIVFNTIDDIPGEQL